MGEGHYLVFEFSAGELGVSLRDFDKSELLEKGGVLDYR